MNEEPSVLVLRIQRYVPDKRGEGSFARDLKALLATDARVGVKGGCVAWQAGQEKAHVERGVDVDVGDDEGKSDVCSSGGRVLMGGRLWSEVATIGGQEEGVGFEGPIAMLREEGGQR
jgi:hypothetical protein